MSFMSVTPSFEPKFGKFMAYNQNKSVIIVDTQNWAVKKTLTDEKVCFTKSIQLAHLYRGHII